MGKSQRDKGARGERALVHYAQGCGIPAKRVPLSGASVGYKGDVAFTVDGKEYKAEVKLRKAGLENIYAFFDRHEKDDCIGISYNQRLLFISCDLRKAITESFIFTNHNNFDLSKKDVSAIRSIFTKRKWLVDSDVLAVKADRRPFLFIVYR